MDLAGRSPDPVAARNNLADTLSLIGCHALALRVVDASLAQTPTTHPLRTTLERTRDEVGAATGASSEAEPIGCGRWQRAVRAAALE